MATLEEFLTIGTEPTLGGVLPKPTHSAFLLSPALEEWADEQIAAARAWVTAHSKVIYSESEGE